MGVLIGYGIASVSTYLMHLNLQRALKQIPIERNENKRKLPVDMEPTLRRASVASNTTSTSDSDDEESEQRKIKLQSNISKADLASWTILCESLRLFSHQCTIRSVGKVVQFKSPLELSEQFELDTGQTLFPDTVDNSRISTTCMVKMLETIQRYSVKTSHRYFFNQMFGALDYVALAGELVALGLNTSPYTYEVAPVFTMLERHLIQSLAKLVYTFDENEDSSQQNNTVSHDGMMIPGGSLSNLTAIHVARHWYTLNWISSNQHEETEYTSSFASARDYLMLKLVAFVSDEAHYSFKKAFNVLGLSEKNLHIVPTLDDGTMDVKALLTQMRFARNVEGKHPFFVGATSGSTVRGSFDPIDQITSAIETYQRDFENPHGVRNVWLHVDGAWGGSAIFSQRTDVRNLLQGLSQCDSFTWNPHKMLGAPLQTTCFVCRHPNILHIANSTQAKYLFDPRKHGAEYDCGDATFTCGRRADVLKIWSMWKYYGTNGLARKVEDKVDILKVLIQRIRTNHKFMLACQPWPFNVNFYYLPAITRQKLSERGIDTTSLTPSAIPMDLSDDLNNLTVALKLKLHEMGEMMIPYQPLNGQPADCFRIILSGNKDFDISDVDYILATIEKYGHELENSIM